MITTTSLLFFLVPSVCRSRSERGRCFLEANRMLRARLWSETCSSTPCVEQVVAVAAACSFVRTSVIACWWCVLSHSNPIICPQCRAIRGCCDGR